MSEEDRAAVEAAMIEMDTMAMSQLAAAEGPPAEGLPVPRGPSKAVQGSPAEGLPVPRGPSEAVQGVPLTQSQAADLVDPAAGHRQVDMLDDEPAAAQLELATVTLKCWTMNPLLHN
eukprot:gene9673-8497_t